MRELIDERAAHAAMNLLAVLLPLAGLVAGAAIGGLRRRVSAGALRGLALGSLGVLNWLLWRIYNAITDRLGLDTVKNLLANLALFLIVGVAGGVAAGLYLRAKERSAAVEPPPAPAD